MDTRIDVGTTEVVLIHHTDCGMLTLTYDAVKQSTLDDTGLRPSFGLESFPDVHADVAQSIACVKTTPFIPHGTVRGFVYDVDTAACAKWTPPGRRDRRASYRWMRFSGITEFVVVGSHVSRQPMSCERTHT